MSGIRPVVDQLFDYFNLHGESPDIYTDLLSQNISNRPVSRVLATSVAGRLSKRSQDRETFDEVYGELKKAGLPELDVFVSVLAKIQEDPALASQLVPKDDGSASRATETPMKAESEASPLRSSAPNSAQQSVASAVLSPESWKQLQQVSDEPGSNAFLPSDLTEALPAASIKLLESLPHLVDIPGLHWERSTIVQDQGGNKRKSLAAFPPEVQETLLLEDLLHLYMGIDGEYVTFNSRRTYTFHTNCDMDVSLREMTLNCLPVAACFVQLQTHLWAFAALQAGTVLGAVAEALRLLLREYLFFVGQLEAVAKKGELTLARLQLYVAPTQRALAAAAAALQQIRDHRSRGGATINTLLESLNAAAGDAVVEHVLSRLLKAACEPYLCMVEKWVWYGQIEDVWGEFMVVESSTLRKEEMAHDYNDAYWEKGYVLRPESAIPVFLRHAASNILVAGKYLNVLRECRILIAPPPGACIPYCESQREMDAHVDLAYRFASRTLLEHLKERFHLLQRLRSVKHFFLLDQGDFLRYFLEDAEVELGRPVRDASPAKLEALLDLSIRTSSIYNDTYRDDIAVTLMPYSIIEQLMRIHLGDSSNQQTTLPTADDNAPELTVSSAFCLSFAAEWPVSLVLSARAVTKYQLLFRHLFHCHSVERKLSRSWVAHQSMKELPPHSVLSTGFALRARMLSFVQNFLYYMTVEVLEAQWQGLEERLAEADTVDDVLQAHAQFQDSALRGCLLTNAKLLRILTKLLGTCTLFAAFTAQFTQALEGNPEAMEDAAGSTQAVRDIMRVNADDVLGNKGYRQTLRKFEENFNVHLKLLVDALTAFSQKETEDHMVSLVQRLDFNDFYSSYFGLATKEIHPGM
jgi:gamma-tubulin complex component 2